MRHQSSPVARIIGCVWHRNLAKQHEQVQSQTNDQCWDGDGYRLRRAPNRIRKQRQHCRSTEQRLHDQMCWQQRRLPQVAPFALSEKKRGVGRRAKSGQHGGPQQKPCNDRKSRRRAQPEHATQPAVSNQYERAPRQPRFTLRREHHPQESFFVIEIPNQQHRGERREQERNGRKRDIPDPIARQSSERHGYGRHGQRAGRD